MMVRMSVHYSNSSIVSDNNHNHHQNKTTTQLECDMMVHGAGRIPNVEGLDSWSSRYRAYDARHKGK